MGPRSLLALTLIAGRMHPMHTAVVELAQAPGADAASVQVRLFSDDLHAALALPHDLTAADSTLARYLRGTFQLADRQGRPLPLRWEGAELTDDVTLVRLTAIVPGGLAGARITSLMLCEQFPDQVNIVRASYDDRTTTVLFLRGEGSKRLP